MRQERDSLLSHPASAVLFVLAAVALAGAALLAGARALADHSHLVTDGACWIWFWLDIDESRPLRFYAERDFVLETVPASARAKMFIDPGGALIVNGARIASTQQRPGAPLRVLEVAARLARGVNRVVIEAESPTGAGGILFCLDLPEGASVVSDASWRVSPSESVLARGGGEPAAVWGRPPMYPWGYPRIQPDVRR